MTLYEQLTRRQDLHPEEMLDLAVSYVHQELLPYTHDAERERLLIMGSLLQTTLEQYRYHLNLARLIAFGYLHTEIQEFQRDMTHTKAPTSRMLALSALYDALNASLNDPVHPEVLVNVLNGRGDLNEPEEYLDTDEVPF